MKESLFKQCLMSANTTLPAVRAPGVFYLALVRIYQSVISLLCLGISRDLPFLPLF